MTFYLSRFPEAISKKKWVQQFVLYHLFLLLFLDMPVVWRPKVQRMLTIKSYLLAVESQKTTHLGKRYQRCIFNEWHYSLSYTDLKPVYSFSLYKTRLVHRIGKNWNKEKNLLETFDFCFHANFFKKREIITACIGAFHYFSSINNIAKRNTQIYK